MRQNVKMLTLVYLIFLAMLSISGSFNGVISDVIYYLAFVFPFILGISLSGRLEKCGDLPLIALKREDIPLTVSLVIPACVLVLLVSYLTSLLIYHLTGTLNDVDIGNNVFLAVFKHALLPALFEEMLFRYLPLKLLPRDNPRGIIFLSAIFFAFAHTNAFSIPYAFVAGLVFMTLDIALNSVMPSLVLHFINNILSVVMIMYEDNFAVKIAVFVMLSLLFTVSLIYLVIKRKMWISKIKLAIVGSVGEILAPEMLLFVIPSLLVALLSLFNAGA